MSGSRIGSGDVERVYASHYGAFCRMAAAVTGDADLGRDAVQEGFAKGLAGLADFRGDGSLPAWLWRIVLRVALDSRRRHVHEGLLPDDLPTVAERWSPVLPHPERDPELAEALASLPDRQRLIVFLRYFADLPHADIAAIAGVEPGTVSATLAQAKAALARKLSLGETGTVEKEGIR